MYELKEPYEIWEKKIELRVKMAESGKGRQMVWRGLTDGEGPNEFDAWLRATSPVRSAGGRALRRTSPAGKREEPAVLENTVHSTLHDDAPVHGRVVIGDMVHKSITNHEVTKEDARQCVGSPKLDSVVSGIPYGNHPCISSSSLNLSKLKSDSASHAPWEGDKAVPNCLVGEMMAMDVEADTGQRKTKWKHLARGIYMLG
ncbi:hypothetical protein ACOSQ3_022387 [Xanthoceras sorbifolium]